MATTLRRLRPAQFRAVVGLSGFVLENELLAMSESFDARPPFFWGRDRDDVVINDAATEHTEAWLHEHTQLTARTYPEWATRSLRRNSWTSVIPPPLRAASRRPGPERSLSPRGLRPTVPNGS